MSHVVCAPVVVRDLAALEEAAKRLGMRLVRGKTTYKWYGRYMNDYHGQNAATQNGVSPEELGKCSHALVCKDGTARTYEVGLYEKAPGEYIFLYDNWSGGFGLTDKIGNNAEKLTAAYIDEVAKKVTLQNPSQHYLGMQVMPNKEVHIKIGQA